jgi:phage baseplate assembly protein gpV
MIGRVGLDRMKTTTHRAQRLRGVHLAVVTANSEQGKDSRYRVKVKFPWLPEGDESYWARILAPMAGASRGTYFLPEIDDQVLVVFEHGEIARPIIVGGLWSSAQKPPQRNSDGKNNIKVIKSKSGHRLMFDDTAGAERLVIVDKTRRNKIVLDSAKDSLTIESAGDIELLAPGGAIKISGKTVKLNAAGAMSGGGKSVNISGASLNAAAGGVMSMGGGQVSLNPPGLGAPAAVGRSAAAVAAALDQVRERVRPAAGGGPGAGQTAAGGSAGAREEAAAANLPDAAEGQPGAVGASAGAAEVQPGQPVAVSAPIAGGGAGAGAAETPAHYEVRDADTGEVIDSGPASVQDGRATATWDSRSLDRHPQTSNVDITMHAGGGSSSTGVLPVAGRGGGPGAPSPSNHLTDPRQPMPATDHRMAAGGGVAGGGGISDRRGGPVTAAPTVDHRGRAQDAPMVDHATATGSAGGAGAIDHRGATAGAAPIDHRGAGAASGGLQDRRSGVTGGAESQVSDHRTSAQARNAQGMASGDTGSAQGAVGGGGSAGGNVRVGSAASSAIDGDGAGAAGAVAGAQVGGALAGDTGAAAGGGAQGELAEGNVKGAAVASGSVDGRAARMDSTDDVEGEVEGESVRQGKDTTGISEGERQKAQAEGDLASKRRDAEYQADVDGRARSEANYEKSKATSEQYRAEREVQDVKAQGDVEGRASAEANVKKSEVKAEQYHAERQVHEPEYQAEGAKSRVENRTADARDPERAGEREADRRESDGRSESGANELERNKDDVERGTGDPRGASRHRVKKLDDDK